MLRTIWKRLGPVWVFACLCGCSLSLENPEDAARQKLAKILPTSLELLAGRWECDSTFTVDDQQPTHFTPGGLTLEIFPDSTLRARDTGRVIWQRDLPARLSLAHDTLILKPVAGSGRGPDTLIVKLRFLGDWLELDRGADYRFAFFHRRKPASFAVRDSVLPDKLWALQGRRTAPDSFVAPNFRRDFAYLSFSGDSMAWDVRANGISQVTSGPLQKDTVFWTWSPPGETRRYIADLISPDSLRLWPLTDGRPDSGFSLFTKAAHRHPFDLNVTPVLGYWRSDSLLFKSRILVNHFGQFYDLDFGADHSVTTVTNMAGLPAFTAWSIDSGFFQLATADKKQARLTLQWPGPDSLVLNVDPGTAGDGGALFASQTVFHQTRVDGSRYGDHPLERFPDASYMHVTSGPDTLRYYFNANFARGTPDRHEILQPDSTGALWLILTVDAAAETFESGQPGFQFEFQGRTPALGLFTCKAIPSLQLTVRLTAGGDPSMALGLLQGACLVSASEKPPADTALAIDGSFRFKRKAAGGLAAPFWK